MVSAGPSPAGVAEATSAATKARAPWGGLALYLAYAAIAARALAEYAEDDYLLPAAALLLAFLVLFAALPRLTRLTEGYSWLRHGCFLLASAIAVSLALLPPAPDYVTALLLLLSFRIAHAFRGRALLAWIGAMLSLVPAPLIYVRGLEEGLALGLSTMAGCIVVPAYVIANRQIEAERAESEVLLAELRDAHSRLEAYSLQAAELAALEERGRLARELHDSVSQTLFSLNLTAGAARLLLACDPAQARPQLERLQVLAQSALSDMRGFIAQLRP
ncbi:MAG: sensor histidine kinase [Anaerolineae bacterium]